MILLRVIFLSFFLILNVHGSPVGKTGSISDRFRWNIDEDHFDGNDCDTSIGSVKNVEGHVDISKAYISKREVSSLAEKFKMLFDLSRNLNTEKNPSVLCGTCTLVMALLKTKIKLSHDPDHVVSGFIDICRSLHFLDEEGCEGFLSNYLPPMIHILKMSDLHSSEVCSIAFNLDCDHGENTDLSWWINVPQKNSSYHQMKTKETSFASAAPKLKVLHISDIHFDPLYKEGTPAECSKPLCCRESEEEPNGEGTLSGPWGGWKCDIPEKTADNMLEHISKQHPDIDYIIWTGDIPPHDLWNFQRNDSLDLLHRTVSKIIKYFPNISVYPALGNHEAVPANLYPSDDVPEKFKVDWLYTKLDEEWSAWLNKNTSETIRRGGFYTMKIRPGLRIVSLNTNYCYKFNWWLVLNNKDPMQELKWLVEVLEEAEKNQEKVHIIGHIPAGHDDCLKIWQKNYYNILERFESTVAAQFFGHTHNDEFELFYDKHDLKNPFSVAYVGPSATTYTYLNPGYRIYYIDGDHDKTTRLVMDHETWIMDLEEANEKNNPEWHKLYSAKEAYNMTSLTPQDWHEFFVRLSKDDDLFQLYYKHFWKNSPRRPPCNEICKQTLFCEIRSCNQYDMPDD